ncbi:MAG: hypothetical protein ABJP45_02245 [Cyclobacteriaceae bacterium]
MESRESKDEKNKRVGWLVSVSIQLFLFILFYFLIAWKAPFPPIPEYGIELGFATSAGSSQPIPAEVNSQSVEEVEEQPSENLEETTPVETPEESDESEVETEVVQVDESEIPIEVEEAANDDPTLVEEAVDESREKVEEAVKEVDSPTNADEDPNEAEEVVEEPKIDDRAIYGNNGKASGSSEGSSLALAGWEWDTAPDPKDTSAETGKIVYKIVVDQDGYLVKIETVTSTVSPSVERKYREAVQKLTFSKTIDYKAAAQSIGTLTFIIKAR